MKDVAAHAGVSYQTVSNVLNGHPSIRPATRERVQQAIAELDYHPDLTAKALREARVMTLCCALYGHALDLTADPYRNLVQAAFIEEANRHGFSSITAFLDGRKPSSIAALRQRFMGRQFAGLVVTGTTLAEQQWREMQRWGVKTVLLDHHLPGTGAVSITADYAAGMRELVQHHAARGRTHLGLIVPTSDQGSTTRTRYEGFLAATRQLGLQTSVVNGHWTFDSGHAALYQMHASGNLPDAVLAASDRMAAGALRAALELGLRVPEDLAISGFDDFEFTRYTTPSLTTVRVPHADMARQAVRSLLALLEGQSSAELSRIFPTTLIVRESG